MEDFIGRAAFGPMALALIGDAAQAQSFAEEIARRHPKNTLTQAIWLPVNRAAIELQRGHPDKAIELLQSAIKYETASSRFWPLYLRGQAYLRLKRGAEAAAEFQKILDHKSWGSNSVLYPLVHLYLGRALVLTGEVAKSRQEYQNFFALWKDADSDLPSLIEAKKEYARLK
jgi:tetratricopeptide (TPR) repeat protein